MEWKANVSLVSSLDGSQEIDPRQLMFTLFHPQASVQSNWITRSERSKNQEGDYFIALRSAWIPRSGSHLSSPPLRSCALVRFATMIISS